MKRAVSLILAGSLALSLAACGSSASSSVAASSAAATTLTGKGTGFGGVIDHRHGHHGRRHHHCRQL